MLTLSQAYEAGTMGLHRLGLFAYLGQRSTAYQTAGGQPIPGTGTDNKRFSRIGATGSFFFGNSLELLPFFMHARDDAALGGGAQAPTWNSGLLEAHYIVHPQLLLEGRYELLRMSKQ